MDISEDVAQHIIDRALMDCLAWACLDERATPGTSRDKVDMWKKALACDLTVYARVVGELSLEYPNIAVPPIVKSIMTLCLSPNDQSHLVCRRIYDLIRQSGHTVDGRPQWPWPVSEWWRFGLVATDEEELDYMIALMPSVINQSATSGAGLWITTKESREVEGAAHVHDKTHSVTRQQAEELLIDIERIRTDMVDSWRELENLEKQIGGEQETK